MTSNGGSSTLTSSQGRGVGSPISNGAYNVIAALQLLSQELERLVQQGQLRLRQPGRAG